MAEADDLEELKAAHAAVVAEARAAVAAGGEPNAAGLEARIRAAGRRARGGADLDPAAVERAERRALEQLERVVSIHRARSRLARQPQAPARPAAGGLRRPALRTRPTITANMDVRRAAPGVLAWDAAPGVEAWELRISERPDARGDYVVRETRELPAATTSAELPLGEGSLRVHLLGRARSGKLVRRAVISGLSRESWGERWQRKASAS